nr:N-6 DNA methylase [Candidatus Baldrarchaeota archaeon]
MNASNEYVQHPTVRKLNSLSNENIGKIVEAYRKFSDIPGFSKVVDIKEIKDNDYNLNVTLYVMPIEEEEPINIALEFSELKKLEAERQEIEKKLEEYISQILPLIGEQNEN